MSKDLVKRLSHSSEQSIRDKAIDELRTMILDKTLNYDHIELKVLFQGLFY